MPKIPRPLDVERMIVLVQERPCIWDTRSVEYHDRYKKEAAWQEVTQELFLNVWGKTSEKNRHALFEEVKNRWRSCRNQFRKEMVHSCSGSGLPKKRPYMFKEQLMFLRAIMDLRPTEDNLEEDLEEPLEQHSSACEAEGPSSPPPTDVEEGRASSASQATAPPPVEVEAALAGHTRRKRPAQPVDTSVNLQVLEYLNRAHHKDTFDLYAGSLATQFRNLPPERYFRIQSLISIALEAATPPNDPSDLFRACSTSSTDAWTSPPRRRRRHESSSVEERPRDTEPAAGEEEVGGGGHEAVARPVDSNRGRQSQARGSRGARGGRVRVSIS
ncbi:uncharacterized protein LOC121002442 [Bufo bufo]|uniref:uncharacterized protein LOC121002442 n=1 Tax=Bufo bufo TaxID=8384 RepID=UPI001ABDF72C|nr:uncharacterized protein LOC121002442 [Bufo bufo]